MVLLYIESTLKERPKFVYGNAYGLLTCSHVYHMSQRVTCLMTCLSYGTSLLAVTYLRYQFTGHDMPLQKLSGVAIFVSLQECVSSSLQPYTGQPTRQCHGTKLGLCSTSSNAKIIFYKKMKTKLNLFHLSIT